MRWSMGTAGAIAVLVALMATSAASAAGFGPGSSGLGDPFFPLAGNGGYDVSDYALRPAYDPATRRLDGHATITATATQDLSRFDLDLRGFTISGLTVNGRAAAWFGDAVTLRVWPDIWLHEGFATFAEWLWREHTGQKPVAQKFKELHSTRASDTSFWNPPPGNPGDAAHLFHGTIYDRGGMTLEALREKIGDATFFRLLRDWYAQNRCGSIDTAGFVALASQASGQDLGHFFDVWLFQPGKPTGW